MPASLYFGRGTKCLIVQTKFSEFSFWNYTEVCEVVGAKYPAVPLGLLTVASLLPQDWDFRLIDENVTCLENQDLEWADIVCTGGMLPQQKSMLSLIERIHRIGKRIVVGGPDPTSQPKIYKDADYLVLGEGEVTIPGFLTELQRGISSGVYLSDEKADMAHTSIPRYDLIRFKDYLMAGIQFTRGCPFNCEFCDVIELYGRIPRYKTEEQILSELQNLYDLGYRGHIDFVDDNFISNRRKAKELLAVIRNWSREHHYPFYFSTEASLNLAEDNELLELMKETDFRYVFLGIETPEEETLLASQKKQNAQKSVKDSVKKILSYGIVSNGGFIVGFDTDSESISDKMVDCVQESGICMAMVGLLNALPNTQLAHRLVSENRMVANKTFIREGDIDQLTSGLNFLTIKPKVTILNEFIEIISMIYNERYYFERVIYNAKNIRTTYKYRPRFFKILNSLRSFYRVCMKMSLDKKLRWHYWKMVRKVLIANPKGLETGINLAAMYLHFSKLKEYLINSTLESIRKEEELAGQTENVQIVQ